MSAAALSGYILLPLAMVIAAAAVVVPSVSRRGWAAASLAIGAWVAIAASPAIGGALALGSGLAFVFEPESVTRRLEFPRLLRRSGLLSLAAAAAVVATVRLASPVATDYVPAVALVATGLAASLVLLTAVESPERARATRMVLVVGAAAWAALTGSEHLGAGLLVALALPLLALAGPTGAVDR